MKANDILLIDIRGEVQSHTEGPKLNGDSTDILAPLHDGEGKFATGKKTGLLSIERQQIGFRQNL